MSMGAGFNDVATSPDRSKIIAANAYFITRRACFPLIVSFEVFELYFAVDFVTLHTREFALNSKFNRIIATRLSGVFAICFINLFSQILHDNSCSIASLTLSIVLFSMLEPGI